MQEIENTINSSTEAPEETNIIHSQKKRRKCGSKLPRTTEEWSRANDYFKLTLYMSNEITDIDQENLQSQIYNHFETTYGTVGGEQTNDF